MLRVALFQSTQETSTHKALMHLSETHSDHRGAGSTQKLPRNPVLFWPGVAILLLDSPRDAKVGKQLRSFETAGFRAYMVCYCSPPYIGKHDDYDGYLRE